MKDRVRAIFNNNILLLEYADKTIFYFRVQNYDKALRTMELLLVNLAPQVELLYSEEHYMKNGEPEVDISLVLDILKELLDAQEDKDYILLTDLIELRLIPFLTGIQETIIIRGDIQQDASNAEQNKKSIKSTDSSLEKLLSLKQSASQELNLDYSVEYTSCGLMTLAIINNGRKFYLHTNARCSAEGFALAWSWYTPEKSNYIIYGLGLGYHIIELAKLDSSIVIEVYESDINIIKLACEYTNYPPLFNGERIKLIYDPDFSRMAKRIEAMDEDDEVLVHYPSLQLIRSSSIKEKIENYFIQYSSVKVQLPLLNGNFRRNIRNTDGMIDELSMIFKGKDLYIVAAGPSLDGNYMLLKDLENKSDNLILATGTVFKKLINAGIKPDYVLVTDPNPRVYKQIAGVEECDVPMLFLSTAYYGFAANYKGKKYMICQKDYPKAEELAGEKGLKLIRTGGSVSTTALDIGITFGCKRIIFLGLDLAYTDNYAHASGTSRRKAVQAQDMRQVEDIYGKMINTGRNLDIFRQWIENRILDVEGVEFIDATEGGAKIKGMKVAKLKDMLKL